MGTKILSAEGLEVVTVSNGDAALKKLGDAEFDLVLADLYMPGLDGYEVCAWVKKSVEHSFVPVVLVVGALEMYEAEKIEAVHADGLLKKPFEASAMMETLRPLLEIAPKARAKKAPPPPPPPVPEVERTMKMEAYQPPAPPMEMPPEMADIPFGLEEEAAPAPLEIPDVAAEATVLMEVPPVMEAPAAMEAPLALEIPSVEPELILGSGHGSGSAALEVETIRDPDLILGSGHMEPTPAPAPPPPVMEAPPAMDTPAETTDFDLTAIGHADSEGAAAEAVADISFATKETEPQEAPPAEETVGTISMPAPAEVEPPAPAPVIEAMEVPAAAAPAPPAPAPEAPHTAHWVAEPAELTPEDKSHFEPAPAAAEPAKAKAEAPPDWNELLKSVEEPGAAGSTAMSAKTQPASAPSAAPAPAAKPQLDEESVRTAVHLCLESALPNLVEEITASVLRRIGK
jgi:CheY-like chemotaxis protein